MDTLTEKLQDSIKLERIRNFVAKVKNGMPTTPDQLEESKRELIRIVRKHYPKGVYSSNVEPEMMFV